MIALLAVGFRFPGAAAGAPVAQRDRLGFSIVLNGGMRFDAPTDGDQPSLTRAAALAAARRYSPAGSASPTVEFARYTSSTTHVASDGRVAAEFRRRPIWLVRYPSVVVHPASAVPARQKHPPVTTVPTVKVAVVVVVDDATGEVLLRSEMLVIPPTGRSVYL